ncbi:MAG: PEP-CTERM sorting domain-containing protein [Myxococcota bacterium]
MLPSKPLVNALAILLALSFAASAGATTVSLVWTSRNGAPIAETTALDAVVGDTAQLEVRVAADAAGVSVISESLAYDTSGLDATFVEICPAAPGNDSAGFCGEPAFGELLTPFPDPNSWSIDDLLGEIYLITAAGPSFTNDEGQANTTFTLGRVDFEISAEGFWDLTPFIRQGIDGAIDLGNNFFIPVQEGASVYAIIPEPGTFLLVGGGLLVLCARRRSA